MKARRGFTFLEILVAVAVMAATLGAFLGLMRETTDDTGKAIFYLRALELGQETIDWAVSAPLDSARRKALEGMSGSLVDAGTGKGVAVPLGATTGFMLGGGIAGVQGRLPRSLPARRGRAS